MPGKFDVFLNHIVTFLTLFNAHRIPLVQASGQKPPGCIHLDPQHRSPCKFMIPTSSLCPEVLTLYPP